MVCSRCVVLGAPAIMADHALIAFGKMLFDHGIPASMVNHKIGGQRRLPHPFPELFSCDPSSGFIRSDPWGLHDFVFNRLDDPFGLSLHVRQLVGNGPLRDGKPKQVMGNLAQPLIGKSMFDIEIGDQGSHPWPNIYVSLYGQRWKIALSTGTDLDHLLILGGQGCDGRDIDLLGGLHHDDAVWVRIAFSMMTQMSLLSTGFLATLFPLTSRSLDQVL